MKKKKKCYIYIRVSTAMQVEGYSLEAQKERLTKFAAFQEMEVVREYCDAGKSGKSITPETVQRNALWTVWWKGKCGHEWRARIADRAAHGEGCKICEAKFQEALPLLLMTFYAKKLELKMITKDVRAIGLELEAYIPEISIAVEFGREKSVEAKQHETVKEYLCRKKGITLVRIAEWSTEPELAEKILQAFAATDIFIRIDTESDVVMARQR